MGMAAYGEPIYRDLIWSDFIARFDPPHLRLKENVHRGIRWWRPELQDRFNLAASVQAVTEEILTGLVLWLARSTGSRHLTLMGGVALNCVANTKLVNTGLFDDVWIMPNPGDGGSSLGAAAARAGRHLKWAGPFLGHDIDRAFDLDGALAELIAGEVIGVANGRAEFGPRALGNRSLLADPRGPATKDRVIRSSSGSRSVRSRRSCWPSMQPHISTCRCRRARTCSSSPRCGSRSCSQRSATSTTQRASRPSPARRIPACTRS